MGICVWSWLRLQRRTSRLPHARLSVLSISTLHCWVLTDYFCNQQSSQWNSNDNFTMSIVHDFRWWIFYYKYTVTSKAKYPDHYAFFDIWNRTGGYIGHHYGSGSGQIWLDYVQCTGNETSIAECQHNGWGVRYCGHYHHVSISCSNNGKCNTATARSTISCWQISSQLTVAADVFCLAIQSLAVSHKKTYQGETLASLRD